MPIKSNIKKLFVLLTGSLILVNFCSSFRTADHPNFSGAWTLNEQKTTYGPTPRAIPKRLTIAANEKSMTIVRVAISRDGQEFTSNETLTFDGKETESTAFGNSKKKSVANWSDDGQTLNVSSTIVFDIGGSSMTATVKEAWKLNGESLSIDSEGSSPNGNTSAKAVYDKTK
ncbi:MAG: hypothetical protein JWN76_1089 [Chitinophagaceae bacterium]|nr:hypothetical protein [Chitinophagaceae bacterium]